MKWFYVRWAGLVMGLLFITMLGFRHYINDLKSISPEQLLMLGQAERVRTEGIVQAGSLAYEPGSHEAAFELAGEKEKIPVHYSGEAPENLRELKTVVVVGNWDPSVHRFEAHEIEGVPNFGFVAGAYLAGMIPLTLFLFSMERRVELLYNRIKNTKLYESEENKGDQG
jgi:cytochrome c-type biogenesis protein CcmE